MFFFSDFLNANFSSSHSPPSLPLQIPVRKKNFYLGNYQSSTFVQTPEIYSQILKFTLNLVPCFCIFTALAWVGVPASMGHKECFYGRFFERFPTFCLLFWKAPPLKGLGSNFSALPHFKNWKEITEFQLEKRWF